MTLTDAQAYVGRFLLCVSSSLFIGFSFYKQNLTQTGLQNALFSIFMIITYVPFLSSPHRDSLTHLGFSRLLSSRSCLALSSNDLSTKSANVHQKRTPGLLS